MKKKGQTMATAMFVMFEILLVVIISVSLYKQYARIENQGIYESKFISRDLALILDAVYGADGNLMYEYDPSSLSKFDYRFDNNKVLVDEDSYPYGSDWAMSSSFPVLRRPSDIYIYKEGKSLEILDSSKGINANYLSCEDVAVQRIGSVTVDPGHGWNAELARQGSLMPGEKGFVNPVKNWTESRVVMDIASVLVNRYLSDAVSKIDTTRSVSADTNLDLQDRKNKIASFNNDLLLSLHVGSSQSMQDRDIIAYVNFKSPYFRQSRYVACRVLNELTASIKDISGTAVVPVILDQHSADIPLQVLDTDKIAVLLELGNIQVVQDNFLVEKRGEIAGAVTRAISST